MGFFNADPPEEVVTNGHDLLAGLNTTLVSYKEAALARAEEAAVERQALEEELLVLDKENTALSTVITRVNDLTS